VSRADDGAEIVRVLDAVEDDDEAGAVEDVVEGGALLGRGEGDDALVGEILDQAVEVFAGLEADGHVRLAAEIDDLLEAGPGSTLDHVDAIESLAGAKGFADGVNTCNKSHGASPS